MNKCCMDECHCDTWNLFEMIQGAYLSSLVKSDHNSLDIAYIEFAAVGVGGWCAKSVSHQTRLRGGIKIGSLTAEILLTLSLCGWWWVD